MRRRERHPWQGGVRQRVLPVVGEVPLAAGSVPSLVVALEAVPEHRQPRGYKAHQPPYPLVSLLLLVLAGLLCGRRGYQAIAEWAAACAAEQPELWEALGFVQERSPRTPVAATLYRLVRDVDHGALQTALQGWLLAVAEALQPAAEAAGGGEGAARVAATPSATVAGLAVPLDQVALDGKTVRGASGRRPEAEPLHLVAAYVPALGHVLQQVGVDGKGRELAAVALLLGRLPLAGRVLTGDALLTQREVCQTILGEQGDYLLPVKDNQPSRLADLQAAFSPSAAPVGDGSTTAH